MQKSDHPLQVLTKYFAKHFTNYYKGFVLKDQINTAKDLKNKIKR